MAKKHPYNEYLNKVLQAHNFSRNSEQERKLNRRFTQITECLQAHYKGDIYAPYKTGSIPKGTAISDYFDLDMLVPFKYESFGGNPKKAFNDIFKVLQRGGFEPRRQNVSIGVPIKLGKASRYIDVVPGIEISANSYEASGGDLKLHVNNKQDKMGPWIKTNIKRQFKHIKKSHQSALAIIKLLKIWKVTNDVYFKSFIIELITIKALGSQPAVKGLAPQLRLVMQYIADYFPNIRLMDPGNKQNNVMDILKAERKEQLANRIKKMLRKLELEEQEGKKIALKGYFPMK